MLHIGENIKKLRKAMGLTQPQLAEKLKLTQKIVSDYETAKAIPPTERLPVIANFFNVTLDELVGMKELNLDAVPKNDTKSRHGNSRFAQLEEIFDQLSPEEQRTTLKQIRGIIADKQRR
jgi:transcriptional regulator with XRE-family HTH domain